MCLLTGKKLDPECISELVSVRKSLMADFQLSPEIVTGCGAEIRDHCNNGLERGGRTIHCLMSNARNQAKANTPVKTFGQKCREAVSCSSSSAMFGCKMGVMGKQSPHSGRLVYERLRCCLPTFEVNPQLEGNCGKSVSTPHISGCHNGIVWWLTWGGVLTERTKVAINIKREICVRG